MAPFSKSEALSEVPQVAGAQDEGEAADACLFESSEAAVRVLIVVKQSAFDDLDDFINQAEDARILLAPGIATAYRDYDEMRGLRSVSVLLNRSGDALTVMLIGRDAFEPARILDIAREAASSYVAP